jgi:hypothetical protein
MDRIRRIKSISVGYLRYEIFGFGCPNLNSKKNKGPKQRKEYSGNNNHTK